MTRPLFSNVVTFRSISVTPVGRLFSNTNPVAALAFSLEITPPSTPFRRPSPPPPRCLRWTSNRPAKGLKPRPAPLCTLTVPRSHRRGQENPRPSKPLVGTLFLPSMENLHRCGLARWPSRTRRRDSAWTRGTDKTLRASASRRTPRPRRNRWKMTSSIWTLPPLWTRSAMGETRTCSNPFGTAVTACDHRLRPGRARPFPYLYNARA